MKKSFISAVAAVGLFAGAAVAENVVIKVDGDAASVLVRDGQIIELVAGTKVATGDRIISAEGTTLTVSNGECERSFAGASAIVMTENFCDEASDAAFVAGGNPELQLEGGPAALIGLAAVAGIATTVVVVTNDDDDFDDQPTSP